MLAAVFLTLALVGVWRGTDVWTWAMTDVYWKKKDGPPGRSFVFERGYWRWDSGFGAEVVWWRSWSQETGMCVAEGVRGKRTRWLPTGRIEEQSEYGGDFQLDHPPWRWGKTDLEGPDAPWVIGGMTVDEWWDSLPESRKMDD